MAQNCSNIFDDPKFQDDFKIKINSFFDFNISEDFYNYLLNKFNNFPKVFYKDFLNLCKAHNYNYIKNPDDSRLLKELENILLKSSFKEFPKKLNEFLKDFEKILSDPKSIITVQEEENLSSSSFIYDKLGQGFKASEYIKEVKDTLFKKLIWDKENDIFITSINVLQDNIFKYYNELINNSLNDNEFIQLLNNNKLPTLFEAKFSDDDKFQLFKNKFTLTYLDNFIQKDFGEFIKISQNFYNNFDYDDIIKYSYSTGIQQKYYKNEEFIDIEQNTEKLIKLFLENFMIYNGDTPTNITFTTSSWAEAINYINIFKNANLEIPIDKLKELPENKSLQDQILLKELPTTESSYLINALNRNPHFYLKYFIQTLLYNQFNDNFSYDNLKSLLQNPKILQLTQNLNINKINLIYSLYKNLFGINNSIQNSTWNAGTVQSQNYLSALMQNFMSTGTIEPVEILTENGVITQRESKASYKFADRRNLENQINEKNQSSQDPNHESFDEWVTNIKALTNLTIEINYPDSNLDKIIDEKNLVFEIKDSNGVIIAEFNYSGGNFESTISDELGDLIQTLTGINYNNILYKSAIESEQSNLDDLAKICFDILCSKLHFLNGVNFQNLKFSQKFKQNYKSAITTNRLSEIDNIASIITAVKGTEKLNVYKDSAGAQISSTNLGNLATTPMIYQVEKDLNPSSTPTSEFKILDSRANFSIKTIRGAKLASNPYENWTKISLPDMFLGTFYTEFIGGLGESQANNYTTTNGNRIGCPCVVNADKTAFYQLFIDANAQLFNNETIKKATSKDIHIEYFNNLQNFYQIIQKNLKDDYHKHFKYLKEFSQSFDYIELINPSLDELWKFYEDNKEFIEVYNKSTNRNAEHVIEINDVFHVIKKQKKMLIDSEINKFSDYNIYEKHAEINDILFAHSLITNNIKFLFQETSDKGYLFDTFANLLGNDKYAYDLIEKIPENAKEEDYLTVTGIQSSFYDKNKTYYIKNKNLKNIKQDVSSSIKVRNKSISPEDLLFLSNSNHKNPYIAPIAKITYENANGEICSKLITQKSDLEDAIRQMSNSKYPYKNNILENPLALYSDEDIKFQLNPLLAKYNAFATLISQEYIISQVGSNLAHNPKGEPSEQEFKEKNPWLIDSEGNFTDLGQIAYHEVLLGFLDRTQQKRNNNNTAQEKRLDTSIIRGLPNKFKVASVEDIVSLGFSANGAEGKMKGMDGATFITYTAAKAINESLGAAKVSIDTMKLFAALYDTRLGIGSNNKTANFTLTNEKIRKDETYQRMIFNMLKHIWKDQNDEIYDPKDTLFTSNINNTKLLSQEVPFYYKVNDKYYARIYKEYDSINKKYVFDEYECDEEGSLLTNEPTPIRLTISDNFELYMALGGWNSCELIDNKLQYSNGSQDTLFEIQVSKLIPLNLDEELNDNTLVDNTKMYKTNYYQPLLMADIFMLFTEGAIKMTHTNLMPADVLFEDTQKLDGSFIDKSLYNYYYQTADVLGPQLDKGHHADNSSLSNMTQVTSACISQGYTPKQALGVYKALGTLSREATKIFRDENLSVLSPERMSKAVFTSLCDHLAKNFDQEENTLLGILTKGIIKDFKTKGYLTSDQLAELQKNIPLDNTQIFKKVYSILGSTLTKNGIKLKVSGNLAVINPTDEIVKYYKIPVKHNELIEQYFDQLCQDERYKAAPRAALYNFLADFKGTFNIEVNYAEQIANTSDKIQWKIVRSNQLPAIKLENYPTTNTQSYIKNILENLSEPVNIQDINIGLNYKITITGEAAINTFWDILIDPNLKEKDKQKQEKTIKELLELAEFNDNEDNKKLVFWANVGLPYYELFKKKKHFIGQQIIKALSTVPDVKVEKLYSKGLDLEFQNVSFEDIEGNKFELTDLMSVQLYCKLSNLENIDDEVILNTYLNFFKNTYPAQFTNYLQFYCKSNLNWKDTIEDKIGQYFIRKIYDFDITKYNQISDFIKELFPTDQTINNEDFSEETLTKIINFESSHKEEIQQNIQKTLIDIFKRFHYKIHQDDLHALSKNSTLSEQITDVYVVNGYTGNTLHNQTYKKVQVNKDSIKNKVCGVIMPKTIKSVLGLDGDDTVGEILADKEYFYKKLLTNANCRLSNTSIINEETGEESYYATWDICLKQKNNKQIYIKTRQDNTKTDYLNDTNRYKKYQNDKDIDGNPIAYSNVNNDQYKLFSPNDEVYYDSTLDCIIIITDPAYIINKNGTKIPIKKGSEQKNLGQFIQENEAIDAASPYQFYIESIPHFVATLNTEKSVDFDFSQGSLNWQLFNNAITKSDTNQFLVDEYDSNIAILDYLRDNNNEPYLIDEPELESLKRYYKRFGKLLHQSFDKILNIIAARIPAQCLQSVMGMRVADFIESDTNNAMVSVYQFYLQGSDLDIDTVSLKTFTLNKQGIFQTHSPYYNLDFDEASTLLPFKPEIKEITINDEKGIAWEDINKLMSRGKAETYYHPFYDAKTNRFNLDSNKNIKTLAKILNLFTEDMPYVKAGEGVDENIVKLLSKHYEYYHKLSKHNQEVASKNYETNNQYNIIIDTSHMSESTASIDNIVSPFKAKGNKSKQALKDWYNTTGNSMSIPLGIRINMEGKDGIALCAVAEKHYFALIGAFQAVLESGDETLKKMLLAGLPWIIKDKNGNISYAKNTIYKGKVGNTIARVVSNAFDSRLITPDFTFNDDSYKYIVLSESEQMNIDETLRVLVEQQRYNPNAALVISAMLSLATDNAKELILGKINAGTEVIDLYLAGASIGLSFDELETIINSNYGLEITNLRKNDSFSHRKALTTTIQAVQQFDTIDNYIKNQFKSDIVIGRSLEKQPYQAVQSYIKDILSEAMQELTDRDLKISEVRPIESFIEKIEAQFQNTSFIIQQFNLDLKSKILNYYYKNQLSIYDEKIQSKINIKDLRDYLKEFLNRNNLLELSKIDPNTENFEQKINNYIEQKIEEFFKNLFTIEQFNLPYEERKKALYQYVKNKLQYYRNNHLLNLVTGENNTAAFFVASKADSDNSVANFYESQKNKAKVLIAQTWDMYLDRLNSCIIKYSTPNTIDLLKGTYKPIEAFNTIANIADEFSRGSRLLINKEIPTQFEDSQKMLNNFEEIFINQFKLNYSDEILDTLKIKDWVKNIKDQNNVEFQFKYLTFTDQGLPDPNSGARLNLDSYVKDEIYRLNCLTLLDNVKTFFNILLSITVLPHYQAYVESLLAFRNATQKLLQNVVYNQVTKPLIIKHKIKDKKLKNNMLKMQQALLESYSINSYLSNNSFIIDIPEGFVGYDEYGNSKKFKNSEQLSLKTNYGRLNFIALVNDSILKWQKQTTDIESPLYNNQFIDKLIIKSNSYTLSGQILLPYTLSIDLNPVAEIDKRIYDETIKHYLNLNTVSAENFKYLNSTGDINNLNLADVFYLYSLLTSGNQVSKVSLSRLVNNQLVIDDSLAQKYIQHQAQENTKIQQSIENNTDPISKNLILNSDALITKYLNIFKGDLQDFLIPIVPKSINDTFGTKFRQIDTSTNKVYLVEKDLTNTQSYYPDDNDDQNYNVEDAYYEGYEDPEDYENYQSSYQAPQGFKEIKSSTLNKSSLNILYVPEIQLLNENIKANEKELIITSINNKFEKIILPRILTKQNKKNYIDAIQKIQPSLDNSIIESFLEQVLKSGIKDGYSIIYEFITTKDVDNSTLTGKCE